MKNNEQTLNAFAYNYQLSKMAEYLNDNSFDKIYLMPLPPIKIEKPNKSISRLMTELECEIAVNQCKENGINLCFS